MEARGPARRAARQAGRIADSPPSWATMPEGARAAAEDLPFDEEGVCWVDDDLVAILPFQHSGVRQGVARGDAVLSRRRARSRTRARSPRPPAAAAAQQTRDLDTLAQYFGIGLHDTTGSAIARSGWQRASRENARARALARSRAASSGSHFASAAVAVPAHRCMSQETRQDTPTQHRGLAAAAASAGAGHDRCRSSQHDASGRGATPLGPERTFRGRARGSRVRGVRGVTPHTCAAVAAATPPRWAAGPRACCGRGGRWCAKETAGRAVLVRERCIGDWEGGEDAGIGGAV